MQDEAIQPPGSTVKQFSVMLQNWWGPCRLLGLLDKQYVTEREVY